MLKRCKKAKQMRKPRLLRIPQAVEYLDNVVKVGTLRAWIFQGKLDTVRVGGAVCIPVEALDALIERGRVAQ
jgi:excisionase family DNA binding protein